MTTPDRNDLMPTLQQKLEWVTSETALMLMDRPESKPDFVDVEPYPSAVCNPS